jgi:hypothetical protein
MHFAIRVQTGSPGPERRQISQRPGLVPVLGRQMIGVEQMDVRIEDLVWDKAAEFLVPDPSIVLRVVGDRNRVRHFPLSLHS